MGVHDPRIPPISGHALEAADFVPLLGLGRPTILDIGAHDGYSSERFLQAFPEATVHCFEPEPRALTLLRSRLAGRARIHPVAISDRDGMATFHQSGGTPEGVEALPSGWHQSGSLRPPKEHLTVWPSVTFEHTITVPTRSLDSWAADSALGDVDLIWMDVQGAEDLVFAGGPRTLARTRFVFTEYSDMELYEGQTPLARLLDMLPGWEVVRRLSMDVLLRNTRWAAPEHAMGGVR